MSCNPLETGKHSRVADDLHQIHILWYVDTFLLLNPNILALASNQCTILKQTSWKIVKKYCLVTGGSH